MSVRPTQTNQVTDTGNIKSEPGTLIWLMVSNVANSSNRYLTLNNATTGSSNEILQIRVKAADSKFLTFPAGFYFSTGIRIGVSHEDLVVTGAYE